MFGGSMWDASAAWDGGWDAGGPGWDGGCGTKGGPGGKPAQLDPGTQAMVDKWWQAKQSRDFQNADILRAQLRVQGINPESHPASRQPPTVPMPEDLVHTEVYDEATESELDQWLMAKRSRNFAQADAIRESLRVRGVNPDKARPFNPERRSTVDPSTKIYNGRVTKYILEEDRGAVLVDAYDNPELHQMEIAAHSSVLRHAMAGPGDLICYCIHRNEFGEPQAALPSIRVGAYGAGVYALKGKYKLPIKEMDKAKGHGFIECPLIKEYFQGKDVYVNRDIAQTLWPGETVKFNCYLNKDLMPNADNAERCDDYWQPVSADLSQSYEVNVPTGFGREMRPPGKGNPKKWVLAGIGGRIICTSNQKFGIKPPGEQDEEDLLFEQAVKEQMELVSEPNAKRLRFCAA